jgi:hypothetical protein
MLLNSLLIISKKEKVHVGNIACYNILTIGINIFEICVGIKSYLVFLLIPYLLLLNDLKKIKNWCFQFFSFFYELSTRFYSILSNCSHKKVRTFLLNILNGWNFTLEKD